MGNVGRHYHTWRYTPPAPLKRTALYVGFLDSAGTTRPRHAPQRREPNNNTATRTGASRSSARPDEFVDYRWTCKSYTLARSPATRFSTSCELTVRGPQYSPLTFPAGLDPRIAARRVQLDQLKSPELALTAFPVPRQFNAAAGSGSIGLRDDDRRHNQLNPSVGTRSRTAAEPQYTCRPTTSSLSTQLRNIRRSTSTREPGADSNCSTRIDVEGYHLTWLA